MARACGEAFANARVALWCDAPSHARFATAEDGPLSPGALVADAPSARRWHLPMP